MADLCLGTAQLGMQYGINNKVGKPKLESVYNILNMAISSGIQMIDTAGAYGESEQLLGNYITEHTGLCKDIKIISKKSGTVKGRDLVQTVDEMRRGLEKTLQRVNQDAIDGYLLHVHREIEDEYALDALKRLKEEGLVKNIGASVYDVDEAELAIERGVDYLQMPCSVFDQRGLSTGLFEKAQKEGVAVFTRSAFLQGLLMMKVEEVPAGLKEIIPYLQKFEKLLMEYELDKRHAVIKYILEKQCIDYMVFGVETEDQLKEILHERDSKKLPEEFVLEVEKQFNNISEKLILPIHWK